MEKGGFDGCFFEFFQTEDFADFAGVRLAGRDLTRQESAKM
jgi:hypothetical protein